MRRRDRCRERLERFGVLPAALEEARIDHADRDVRGNCRSSSTSDGVNWSLRWLSMLSAPIGRFLCSSTTTSAAMPGTTETQRADRFPRRSPAAASARPRRRRPDRPPA